MKKLNALIFLIFISYIYSFDTESCTATSYDYNLVNYDKTDRVIEFDWTDDDKYNMKITFINDVTGSIEPYFVNATVENVEELDEAYDSAMETITDNEGYLLYNKISDTKTNVGKTLSVDITPKIVKANKEVITQKFYKYFGWVECSGYKTARFRKSQILIVVNNGKLYEMSKYLLFVAAALIL